MGDYRDPDHDEQVNPGHYRDFQIARGDDGRPGEAFESADIIEAFARRWHLAGVPADAIGWMMIGMKYLTRLGRKDGEGVLVEIGKVIWYFTRARGCIRAAQRAEERAAATDIERMDHGR